MVKFWTKLLNLDDNNITKKIYNMLKNEANNNSTLKGINLASHMKTLLDRLGLSNLWANQDTLTINYNYIKQRIIDNYIQIWHSNIHESKRLESYSKFKENFELEEYLSIITNKKYITSLTKFRLSSHELLIEKGRHLHITREDRLCKYCNMNLVENEYHFLLVCPKYANLIKEHLTNYYCRWPTVEKFKNLMSSKSRNTLINSSKYI